MANDVLIQKEQAGKMAQQNGFGGYNAIKEYFEKHKTVMTDIVPTYLDREYYFKSQMLYISQNDALQKCTKESLFRAVCQGAELGLSFNQSMQQAYCIPYGNEAKFMPSYRGMIDLIRRTNIFKSVDAHVVYDNDDFSIAYGSEPKLIHNPCISGDRGSRKGAYAVAFFKDNTSQFIYMNNDELEAVKNKSKAKNSMAWVDFPDEMYRKTAVRRLFKYLPSTPEIQPTIDKLIAYDDENNGLIKEKDVSEKPESKTKDLLSRIKSQSETVEEAVYEDLPQHEVEVDTDGLFK